MLFRRIAFIKDLLFPLCCVGCGEEGDWWCKNCQTKSTLADFYFCPSCGAHLLSEPVCQKCASAPLKKVMAFFNYHAIPAAAQLIHLYKYRYAKDILKLWRKIIANYPAIIKDTVIMPVPLFARRERERGFNQAELLACLIAKQYNLPLDRERLQRSRATKQQAALPRAERLTNVRGAFIWSSATPSPARVTLVDDVFTTGATMRECAQVLREHGTLHVEGIVLARG